MTKVEAQPSQSGLEREGWTKVVRNAIQVEVMGRMDVPVNEPEDQDERWLNNEKVIKWVDTYARRFAEITDGDLRLQGQLMSDDMSTRESAIEEVVSALREDKK